MKPILFNTKMVQAIQRGYKTVTRRIVKPQPAGDGSKPEPLTTRAGCWNTWGDDNVYCQPYRPGDILYVRETWAPVDGGGYIYRAGFGSDKPLWHPSIHMPREAARIFLRVTDVRVERLQDIGDCTREGIPHGKHETAHMNDYDERCDFKALWDSTIKPADCAIYGWDANPWVWVIEFERISKEEAMNDATD